MLVAAVEDFSQLPGVDVVTVWSESLGPHPFGSTIRVEHLTDDQTLSRDGLQRVAGSCGAAFVVAPECDGILAEHQRWISETGCRWLGCSFDAISLCTDKWLLARHLAERGVPVIPAEVWQAESDCLNETSFPLVIKPRDGAGSQATYRVDSIEQYRELLPRFRDEPMLAKRGAGGGGINQPFIRGVAVSVAVLIGADGETRIPFPVCEQQLSVDGRFHYIGGRVPARIQEPGVVQRVAIDACRAVPGLRGYVGVDVVVPDSGPQMPLVVELNPRLTTSYLGYRALAAENLAPWLLGEAAGAPRWESFELKFDVTGVIRPR
jgi:predicted ATP-grasp superfamily ATP-dependent carboligase